MKMLTSRITKPAKPRVTKKPSWGQGRGGRPWQRMRERVFESDGFLCRVCRAKGRLEPVELHGSRAGVCDHIVPMSQGGGDHIDNLQTLCQACDKVKTYGESRGVQQSHYSISVKGGCNGY